MKLAYFLVLLTLLAEVILAGKYRNSATFFGCPDDCPGQEGPKCERGLPKNGLFAAMPAKYFDKYGYKLCDTGYYVGMAIDPKADGKYKMVKAKIVDQCGRDSCYDDQIDLSTKAFSMVARKKHGVIKMMHALVKDGKIVEGPYYSGSAVKKFAKKRGVSKNAVIRGFKKAAVELYKSSANGRKSYPPFK